MIKQIIFDLDGTLLDTIDDLATSSNYALSLHGFPVHPLGAYRYFVGNGVRELLRRALPEENRTDEWVETLRKDFVTHYDSHNTVLTKPYEGIPELLKELKSSGIVMAVASNKYHEATCKLTAHYFGELFAVVLGQREGIPHKPDPTVVRDIIARTGIPETDTWYVGDSSVDMMTAAHAGLTSIGVGWGFRPKEELRHYGAHFLVDRAEEITDLLNRVNR